MIDRIVKTFKLLNPRWSLDEVLAEVPKFGMQLSQRVGNRCTFVDDDLQKYSFYFNDNDVIGSVESSLAVECHVDGMSEPEYERFIASYIGKFEHSSREIQSILGDGKYYTLENGAEFPHDRDSIRLSLWKFRDVDIMLELKHEARDVPVRLILTLVPRETE